MLAVSPSRAGSSAGWLWTGQRVKQDWSEGSFGGKMRRGGVVKGGWRGIFRPLHGSALSVSQSAAAAAFRLVPLVGESAVSGQKPQPLPHML